MNRKKKPTYYIHGQSEQLSRDIHEAIELGISNAIELGVSYGKYMELKKEGMVDVYRRRLLYGN